MPRAYTGGSGRLHPRALAAEGAALSRLAHPPALCPGCLDEEGIPFPDGATSRHCPRCVERIRGGRSSSSTSQAPHVPPAGAATAATPTAERPGPGDAPTDHQ